MAPAKKYSLWASIVRIVATYLIFYFHFEGLHYRQAKFFDLVAIALFLVISGYFSYQPKRKPNEWIVQRFKQILIPYWPIISVVLLINALLQYKDTNLMSNILIFFGFSIFIENPVYVISWFITLILMFYLNVYFFRMIKNKFVKIVYLIISFILFYNYHKVSYIYFLSYYLGYYLKYASWFANMKPKKFFNHPVVKTLNERLFIVQSYCYVFFLLHGGVLLFVIKILKLYEAKAYYLSLAMTVVSAYFYKNWIDGLTKKYHL